MGKPESTSSPVLEIDCLRFALALRLAARNSPVQVSGGQSDVGIVVERDLALATAAALERLVARSVPGRS